MIRLLADLARPVRAWWARRLPARAGGRFRRQDVDTRTLGPGDLESLVRLEGGGASSERREWLAGRLSGPAHFCVGVFRSSELVAAGWCGPFWSRIGLPGPWLNNDVVRRDLRGRGLGQILHRARIAEAGRRGFPELFVDVAASNRAALGALRAVGFVEIRNPTWAEAIRTARRESGRADRPVLLLRRRL